MSTSLKSLPILFVMIATIGISACSSGSDGFNAGPPAGWESDGTKWWLPGTDTSVAFRSMTTLAEMGVSGANPVYVSSGGVARESSADQSVRAVKASLLQIYRNEPEIVDSLFTANIEKRIREAPFADADFEKSVSKWQKQALKSIHVNFREPFPTSKVGKDVIIVYPDSLSKAGVTGNVSTQVYLNEKGEPIGITLIHPVHPVLDDLAMKAASQMKWQPAYILRSNKTTAIPAWVRYNVSFTKTVSN